MKGYRYRILSVALAMGLWGGLVACVTETKPLGTHDAKKTSLDARREMIRRWRVQKDPAQTLNLLALLWSDREPRPLRFAALDALAIHAPEALWSSATRYFVGVDDPEIVAAVCRRAASDHRVDTVETLIRRWARPLGHPAFGPGSTVRPEAQSVDHLTNVNRKTSLTNVLQQTHSDETAAAAWSLLQTVVPGFDAKQWAKRSGSAPASAVGRALVNAANMFATLPFGADQVRGLTAWTLANPEGWQRVREIKDATGASLALRHLPALSRDRLAPAVFRDSKSWRLTLRRRLHAGDHVPRRVEGETRAKDSQAGLQVNLEGLLKADLFLLDAVLAALDEPPVIAAFFDQADADQRDLRSEHGGGLLWPSGHPERPPVAVPFSPARSAGDHTYVTSDDLLAALYRRGLAHYHFHAQRHDHADYAGPGEDDLRFVQHCGLLCLTLTFIDADHLNVDVSLPDGGVLDVGCIKRLQAP